MVSTLLIYSRAKRRSIWTHHLIGGTVAGIAGSTVIRVNPAPDANLIGRVFLRDRLVVVASPNLKRPKDGLSGAAVVRGTGEQPAAPEGKGSIAVTPVLSLSSMIMIREAVRAGAGVARLPISLVSADLAAGRLLRWGDLPGPKVAIWTLYPSRRLLSARVLGEL